MKGKIAGKAPMAIELEKGKNYAWCSCGLSTNQPFCDGKHAGSGMAPVVFTAEESKTAYMCTCKQSESPQFCDGSHSKL